MKIKTETSRENGFKETEIGLIPKDWDLSELTREGVAKLIMGQSPPSSTYNENKEGLPFLQGKAEFGRECPSPEKWCTNPSRIAEKNDVLISVRAPVGDVNISPFQCAIGRGLAAIRADRKSLPYFLFYYLQYAKKRIEEKGTGSTFKAINKSVLQHLKIILPDISEQHKITFVLLKIQQAIEYQEKLIKITIELKKSLMNKLFAEGLHGEEQKKTEIGLIPKSWDVVELGDICEQRKESIVPNGKGENKYIGLEHIVSGETWLKSFGYDNEVRSSKFIFNEQDVLYGKLRPYLDKAAVTDFSGVCSTDIIVLTPNDRTMRYFIVYFLHLNKFIEYAKATTSGVNHPRTSWNSLKKFKLALPKLPEQKEIANILLNIDNKLQQSETRKQTLQALFKTMLNQLMTGRIRVKNLDIEVN